MRLRQKMILSQTIFYNWNEFAAKKENDFCLRINLYNCFELEAKTEKKLS